MINALSIHALVYFNIEIFTYYRPNSKLSDFQRLSQEDQLILIRCGFYEIWLTRMARLFNLVHDCVLFSDGSLIKRVELETVYGVRGGVPSAGKN